jgi:DNA-binding SARP family transcriptional activator
MAVAKYALETLTPLPRLVRVADGVECIRFSKQLAVLAYLTSRPEARATRDELVGLLWSGASQQDGRGALRQVVYQIRRATDQELLRGDEILSLRRPDIEVDADLFRQLLATGHLDVALALYEQDFLSSVALAGAREFEQWAEGVRALLAAERRQLLRTLIARESDAGRWAEAAHHAELLIAADPASLDARLKLIELLALSGDALRADAEAGRVRAIAAETSGDTALQTLEDAIARAVSPSRAPERRRAEAFPRTPEMVGRATQFRAVVEKWKAARVGHGGAVLVTGEAGIGKSRLARELARRFDQDRSLVLQAGCFALEQSDAHAPFLELLRAASAAPGLAGATPGSLETLAALVPEIASRFRSALVPRQPPIPPQAVAGALIDAFGAIADEAPLALVVEDLHWASPDTIEFAHHLAREAAQMPLLLLLTARDFGALLDSTHALHALSRSAAVAAVPLDPLDEPDIENLLGSIAELPPEVAGCCLAADLVQASDGIPLYVLEILKALQERASLVVRNGQWAIGPSARVSSGRIPLPASTREILTSRLENLSPWLLEVLVAVAVWGREGRVSTIAEIAGLDPSRTEEALATLARRRLVTRRDRLPAVAHDEIAAAALELAPADMVLRFHARAASVTAERAARGRASEWVVAAMHAVSAGDADAAMLWAARAAREAERLSGHAAGREMIRRVLEAAPPGLRPLMEQSLGRLADGSWTARRWLAHREGQPRRLRYALSVGAVAVLVAGVSLAPRFLHTGAPELPLGGADLALGWGLPGHPDSIEALFIDSRFVGRYAPRDSLPAGERDGYAGRLTRPDLTAAAFSCPVPGRVQTAVCVRDLVRGGVTEVARFDAVAVPVGWLPDGSGLVALRGYPAAARGAAYGIVLLDSLGRTVRTITRDTAPFDGAWMAPTGQRILALRAREGRYEAALLDLSGAVLGIIDWCSRAAAVAWSPDGRRLACVPEDVHLLQVGDARPGSWPTHVSFPDPIQSGPVWSGNGRYLAVSVGGVSPGIFVVDRDGMMEPRRVASFRVAPRLFGWVVPGAVAPLHKIRVDPDSLHLRVGDSGVVRARGLGPHGEALGDLTLVRWLSGDSSIARVNEDGRVSADRPGSTFVIASFGLERVDDTAYVRVAPALTDPVVEDDFEHGLDTARWRLFGEPPARLVARVGRHGSVGVSSGGRAASFGGIVLRQPLDPARGLTIQYWVSVPARRPLWGSVRVGLYPEPADSVALDPDLLSDPANLPAVSVEAPVVSESRRQLMAQVVDARPRFNLVPLPDGVADGAWHRYRLVVYAGGEVRWFVDGAEAVPPGHADLGGRRTWTLAIGGQSPNTATLLDDVAVWRGVVLEAVEPSGHAARRARGGRRPR